MLKLLTIYVNSFFDGLMKNDKKMDVICLIDGIPFLFFLIGNMMSLLGYDLLSCILMKK